MVSSTQAVLTGEIPKSEPFKLLSEERKTMLDVMPIPAAHQYPRTSCCLASVQLKVADARGPGNKVVHVVSTVDRLLETEAESGWARAFIEVHRREDVQPL